MKLFFRLFLFFLPIFIYSQSNGTSTASIVNCNFASAGTLVQNNVATAAITQTIQVNVVSVGTYNFSSYVAGVTFSAVGSFTSTGLQTVVLVASGTPSSFGNFTFYINGSTICNFVRNVLGAAPSGGCFGVEYGIPGLELDINSNTGFVCENGQCYTLNGSYVDIKQTTDYTVSSIPYAPPFPFNDSSAEQLDLDVDDIWSAPIPLGFNFCFYGNYYSSCQIGTNGVLTFTPQTWPGSCNWNLNSHGAPLPSTNFPIRNAIYGVYQDLDPEVNHPQKSINYKIFGTAPCRTLVFNVYEMPQFSCGLNVGNQTSQVVLYEGTNIIDIYIQKRTPCTTWNSGRGVVGIQNANGTAAKVPAGRGPDSNNWSAFNEAWRFTPNGASLPVTFSWLSSTTPDIPSSFTFVSNNLVLPNVCPTQDITYRGRACYTLCDNSTICVDKDINLQLQNLTAGSANDLVVCKNEQTGPFMFDLCSNTASILAGSVDIDDLIKYYSNLTDLENQVNELPCNYSSLGNQTIYARANHISSNCKLIRPFQLIVSDFTINQPDDIQACGIPFDLTTVNPQVLGTLPATDYHFEYYENENDAHAGSSPILVPTAYSGSAPIIYVKVIANTALPNGDNCYKLANFNLELLPNPNVSFSGTATICQGTTATISIHGTSGTSVTYTDGTTTFPAITIPASGVHTFTHNGTAEGTVTYSLVGANLGVCSQGSANTAQITVTALPTATLVVQTPIFYNNTSLLTFTGTPNTVVQYSDGVNIYNIVLDASGNASAYSNNLTSNTTFSLVDATVGTTPNECTNSLSSVSATVIVHPQLTATITGSSPICYNTQAILQFTGSPFATVNFTDGTSNYFTVLNASGNGSFTTPYLTGNTTFTLTSSSITTPVTGSNAVSGSFTVQVISLPVASVVIDTPTVCYNTPATLSFTGTANATVGFAVGSSNYTTTLDGSGVGSFTTPTLTSNTTVTLINASISSPITCVNVISGGGTINVVPQVTASISVQTPVCYNSPSQICITGTPGATINLTDNNGNPYSVTLNASGTGCIATPNLIVNTIYTLQSGSVSSPIACSNSLSSSATVAVRPLIAATISATSPICSGQTTTVTITGTPEATILVDNGSTTQNVVLNASGVGSFITPILTADATYTLVSGSITSPISCSNAITGSFMVDVVDAPVPGTPTAIHVCDVNNDGIATFDMTPAIAQAQAGNTNWQVRFYETPADAAAGLDNFISNYTSYTNITVSANSQIVDIRVVDPSNPNCYGLTSVLLVADPTPELNTSIDVYELCETTKPGDGFEVFNLTSKSAEILDGVTGVTLTYYTSQSLAQAGVVGTDISNSSTFTNTVNPQTIWVRGQNALGCFDVTSFELMVNPLPTLTALDPMFGCSNGTSTLPLVSEFDLNINNPLVTGGVAGMMVTYHLTQADADNESGALASPYTNTANPQTLYVRVENNDTGCYDTTTLALNVTEGPIANVPDPLEVCDPDSDGKAFFDLTQAINDISGGSPQPGVTITFHETPTDAQFGNNAITAITNYPNIVDYTQTIWVRVAYATGCYNMVALQLVVHPTPEATTPDDLHACDGTDNNGIAQFDLTQAISEVMTGLTPVTDYTVSFYTTLATAQAGGLTGKISNVTNYPGTDEQEVFIRVEHTTTGCFDVVSVILQVHGLPTMPTPESIVYTLCDVNNNGDEKEAFNLNSQIPLIIGTQTDMNVTFHLTLADAQNDTGALASPYTNLANPQSLFVRVEDAATGCYNWVIMDIRVAPLPTIVTPDDIEVCDYDGNPDLSTPVDLTALIPDILNGETGVTVTFHYSQTDADLGLNIISNPTAFTINDISGVQTIYIRAENGATGCYSTAMFIITVYNPPVMPTLPDLELCDVTPNIYDGKTYFDLTVQNPLILATNAGHQVRYYKTQADAEAGLSAIINPTNYYGTDGEVIWVRVLNIATGCMDIGSFVLHVNTPVDVRNQNNLLSLCDSNLPNDNFTAFDLTVMNAQILALATAAQSPATVTYYPSYLGMINGTENAISNPNAYINQIATVQTLGVMVTSAKGCVSYTSLTIRVLPIPNVKTDPPALAAQCDYTTPGDMQEFFNLTTHINYILNGNTAYVVSYHATQSDATADINPIIPNNYYGGGSAWIRVENNWVGSNGVNCAVIIEQQIPVNPLPVVINDTYTLCETNNLTGISTFDLTTQITDILGTTQNPSDYTVSFYVTQAEANTGTNAIANAAAFQNTTNPQTIYVRVVNNATGCFNTGTLELSVSPSPSIGTLANISKCDYDGINDGKLVFNFITPDDYVAIALNGQDPSLFTVTMHETQADANAVVAQNPLTDLANYVNTTPENQTIWVRVTNNATGCFIVSSFMLHVEILAEPNLTNNTNGIACVAFPTTLVTNGLVLDSGVANPSNYTFTWYKNNTIIVGATGSTYTITNMDAATDTYKVMATSISSLACNSAISNEITITRSSAPSLVGEGYVLSNYFEDNQTLTILVNGYSLATYLFQLDNGPKQISNVFTNVSAGVHTVTVYDPTSDDVCGTLELTGINAVNYPHYFTPNGDGYNDRWQIVGLEDQPEAKVMIFDRYGKLVKQISTTGAGWDGTFNGNPLPATDYWFAIEYIENNQQKTFKAHFALKR